MIHEYPYTDFNEYNLDWVIKRIVDLTEEWTETKTEWTTMKADLEELKTFITTYFDELDVQEEINNKIDEMVADGSLLNVIRSTVETQTATTTASWLTEHITQPEGVVIDTSLTVAGACADAKATGDAITDVNDAFKQSARGYNNPIAYINGSFGSNGVNDGNLTRLRTEVIPFIAGEKITIENGSLEHACGIWEGEVNTANNRRNDNSFSATDETIYTEYDGFIVVVFRFADNRNIIESDYDGTVTVYTPFYVEYADSTNLINSNHTELVDDFNEVLDTYTIEPTNKLNPATVETGRYIYNGSFESNSSYKTSDFISVKENDIIRFYEKITSTGSTDLQATTGERIALFNINKRYLGISSQYPVSTSSGYTINNADVKYIRISYSASFSDVELTINLTPTGSTMFEPYFEPYEESHRLQDIENQLGIDTVNIIDCWGDSRTDMSTGTAFSDYLSTLIGNSFIVSNHGLSGQSIGEVGLRFGSNEVYVTLENNQIPASGAVNITDIVCSVGSREGYNMETADDTKGSHCILNGVQGILRYHRSGLKTFTRDSEGVSVSVKPVTKLLPEGYFNKRHMQILWAGKNDFAYGYPYTVSGIIDNYDAMVKMIPHNKFLILGETLSNDSTYEEGKVNRQRVYEINEYLTTNYPDNFINIQNELMENGLTLESITPTAQDQEDINNGFIPTSLMYDKTHLNQYGREAVAKIIYAWMQDHNWLN